MSKEASGPARKNRVKKVIGLLLTAVLIGGGIYLAAQFQISKMLRSEDCVQLEPGQEISLPFDAETIFVFRPDHEGYYGIEVTMNREMEKDDVEITVHRNQSLSFSGVYSMMLEDGQYLLRLSKVNGKLYPTSDYFIQMTWTNMEGVESIRLIEVDEEVFNNTSEQAAAQAEKFLQDENVSLLPVLGENLSSAMKTGGDNWYSFAPETAGQYCFYAEFTKDGSLGNLQMEVYKGERSEADMIGMGISAVTSGNRAILYIAPGWELEAGVTYHIRFIWPEEPQLKKLYLTSTGMESNL